MRTGRLRHDGILFSRGVSAMWSGKPTGAAICTQPKTRPDQKIDAAVALIGGAMAEDEDQVGPEVFSRTIATTTRRALDPKMGPGHFFA
jgi:hypothetical protein